ncbi:MAG: dienelactone hydrolase family protein [Bacteroidetes bacterium]|nr:dienelactone hydrolase family protein [Bacteroidota bacterium]
MLLASCKGNKTEETTTPKMTIKSESVEYTADSIKQISFVAYDESNTNKRPIVLVIPEWWGLNDYAKGRAKQLAELGYLAIAVDMYGEGKTADNPKDAGQLAGPFYQNPMMAKSKFDAALARAKTYAVADTTQIAAIGYCFGGSMVLNMARLGENLNGVVSFHGNLVGVPADKNLLKSKILVCHGEADQFVPPTEVATFKRQLDSIGAPYIFKSYPEATHAFTNPASTENGKKFSIPIAYNAAADSASWIEMKSFFGDIFKKN